MCRYCREDEVVSVGWLDPAEDPPCEWCDESEPDVEFMGDPDDEGPECPEPARVAVGTKICEGHLCQAHAAARQTELKAEGLGEFLASVGLQDDFVFAVLDTSESEICDYCGEAAAVACLVTITLNYCRAHALDEVDELPPDDPGEDSEEE